MRTFAFLVAAIFLGVSGAFAQTTTAPSTPNTSVLIIPFKQVGDTSAQGWVSSAIEENLISEAAHSGLQPKSQNQALAAADSSQALQAAREAGASLVIFGSYQVSNDQLRVSGQVNDVATGKVIGTLGVTGRMLDLFKIEDTLGAQLRPLLPQPQVQGMPQVFYGGSQAGEPYQQSPVVETQNSAQGVYPYTSNEQDQSAYAYPYSDSAAPYASAPYTYAYPDYGYDYAAPSYVYPYYTYDYGYPGFFGGIYFGNGFRGGFNHRGFNGGFRAGGGHGGFSGGFRAGGFSGGISGGHAFGGGHR